MKNAISGGFPRQASLQGAIQLRSLWDRLNELRGFSSTIKLSTLELRTLKQRFANLRDEIGAHFMLEWGMGLIGQAVFNRQLSAEQCEQLRLEQFAIFDGISTLADEADMLLAKGIATHASMRALMDRFRQIDSLLIAHESSKQSLIRGVLASMNS